MPKEHDDVNVSQGPSLSLPSDRPRWHSSGVKNRRSLCAQDLFSPHFYGLHRGSQVLPYHSPVLSSLLWLKQRLPVCAAKTFWKVRELWSFEVILSSCLYFSEWETEHHKAEHLAQAHTDSRWACDFKSQCIFFL